MLAEAWKDQQKGKRERDRKSEREREKERKRQRQRGSQKEGGKEVRERDGSSKEKTVYPTPLKARVN